MSHEARAAMRAAETITRDILIGPGAATVAEVIDRETGLPQLIEAWELLGKILEDASPCTSVCSRMVGHCGWRDYWSGYRRCRCVARLTRIANYSVLSFGRGK